MTAHLCIDFGNTNAKLSVYEDGLEVYYYKDTELSIMTLHDLIKKYGVKKTIISSTRDLSEDWIHQLEQITHLTIVDHHTPVPIQNLYHTPETLGKDRLAAVIGARRLFPNETCVVIDAGTCITMDVINAVGQYLGGNISPGMYMRRQAMHDFTDKLPLVDLRFPSHFVGKDTTMALQNGILRGTIYEVESFIKAVFTEFGPGRVIFTGGDRKFFEETLKFPIFAASNLVLIGLHEILTFNEY